jgi:hypothetical protein
MSKKQLLAAETFAYSYANYADHLGVNARFDEYMPRDIEVCERAVREGSGASEVAETLGLDLQHAEGLLESYMIAKEIVEAGNAAKSFRRAVKASIVYALENGLHTEEDIEQLVGQVCYRAADLAYLLDVEGKELSEYSQELRE